MTEQGGGFVNPPYGQPSPREKDVVRVLPAGNNPFPTGSRTRIEKLYGAITPNCLLFERDHVGVPAIGQARHRLMIHGLVSRPLLLTMDELMRFPSVSRFHFLECSGNSAAQWKAPAELRHAAYDRHDALAYGSRSNQSCGRRLNE